MIQQKILLTWLASILMFCSACNAIPGDGRFSGFEKVIDVDHITPVPGEPGQKIIDLNIPATKDVKFDYNRILKDLRFVQLEKTSNSAIGHIDKIFFSDNRIIVADLSVTESVFIFDASGRFINKIAANKNSQSGPTTDVANILDVAYYYNTSEIVIHDDKKNRTYYFDSTGRLERFEKEYIDFFQFYNFKNTDHFIYLALYSPNKHIPLLTKSDFYLGKANTQILHTDPNSVQSVKIKPFYNYKDNLSFSNDGSIFYTPVFSDTIYFIDGKQLNAYPKFALHFPGPEVIPKIKEDPHAIDMTILNKFYNSHQYYYFLGKILSAGDSIYYIECYKDNRLGFFYSEKTGKFIGGNIESWMTSSDSSVMEGYQYPIASTGSEFVSILSPGDVYPRSNILWTTGFSKAVANMVPNGNPMLVFYKLKQF